MHIGQFPTCRPSELNFDDVQSIPRPVSSFLSNLFHYFSYHNSGNHLNTDKMKPNLHYLLPTLPLVKAWGSLGHTTVAYLATNFLTPSTSAYLQTLLDDTSPSYLAHIATWADSYRYTTAGRWTAPLHYIDAADSPPTTCNLTFRRDCSSGCIISAISNYTTRLSDLTLLEAEKVQAAKFLVHFLGDVHQPLHDEGLERGGNGINVTFDGRTSNLHAVWDTAIPERRAGGYSLDDAFMWASNLSTAVRSGVYSHVAQSWLDGMDVHDPIKSSMIWATEANRLVCEVVLKEGKEALAGKELNGTYYEAAIDVVELQIAKAGYRYVSCQRRFRCITDKYRLATWLNLILEGKKESYRELR